MNVVFVTDDNYFKPMFVAIESIISQLNKEKSICFFIIDLGINDSNKNMLIERYEKSVQIKFKFFTLSKREKFEGKTHASSASYAKVFIADVITEDYAIYLDCDVIVNGDLYDLWCEFEENTLVKAVWNPFYNYDNEFIGVDKNARTFNSGVMILNLKKMRENNSSRLMESFLKKYNHKTKLQDQAAFNAAFKNNWKELDYSWNYQVSMIQNRASKLNIEKKNYIRLLRSSKIIHFTSNSKPWQFRNSHPYKKMYLSFYESLFGKIVYKDTNLKAFFQKLREKSSTLFYTILNILY